MVVEISASEISTSQIGDKQKLIRGSIFMTLSPVTALFLGLIISVLISVYIPPAEYAVYSWYNLMNSFLITTIPFALPQAITRFLAIAKGANNEEEIQQLQKDNTFFTLALVPLSGIIAIVITPLVLSSIGFFGQYGPLDIAIFALGIMCVNLSLFTIGAGKGLQAFENIGLAQFAANLVGQLLVILLIITGWSITALLIKWVVVGLLTSIFLTIGIKQLWTVRGGTYSLKPLLFFAYPAILSFFFAFFFKEYLIRALFMPFGADVVGLYEFAARLLTFVNALTIGFYTALGPYYSRAVGRGPSEELESEVKWTLKFSNFMFLPIIVGIVVISPSLFLILFDPRYYFAYQFFAILMVQMFLYLFYRPFVAILNSTGRPQSVLVITIISSLASGLLMLGAIFISPLFLIERYTLAIVVLAYSSSVFFASLLSGFWVKKQVKINTGFKAVLPFIGIAAIMIPPAIAIHLLRLHPVIEFASIFIISLVLYVLPIRIVGLISENEIRKATLFLPSRVAVPFSNFLVKVFVKHSLRMPLQPN